MAQGVPLADQVLHHGVRTLVRSSAHHETRTLARHHCVHHGPTLVDARTHDEAAHAVRQQPDRLIGFGEEPFQERAQAFGEHVERLTPVVREGLDAMRLRELPAQLPVGQREELFRLDPVRTPADLREAARHDVSDV